MLPLYGAFLFAQNEAVQCLVGIYLSALIGLITPTFRYDRSPFLFGAYILEVMPYGFLHLDFVVGGNYIENKPA